MVFLYIVGVIAIIQGLLSIRDGLASARHIQTFRPPDFHSGRVLVFCPCKGLDPEFDKNIRSLLDQDYHAYDVQFIVESQDDEAYAALQQMGITNILVAGRAADCGQKVHNLAYAVHQSGSDADVYVFCDSDARYPRTWLSSLTAALTDANVTTGYRWYAAPGRFHFPTLLRSAWNASVVTMLGGHSRNFAWGGSMAMRRSTFQRLGILEAWRGSVSDDYAVTRAAQHAGVPIVFVPECLIPSYGSCTFPELLEFTTRQITITRVYHGSMWRLAFVGQIVFCAAFFGFLAAAPWMSFVIYILAAAKSWIRMNAVRSVLPPQALPGHSWFYMLSAPLVGVLYLYNMARSALSTDIVWRQIRYKLISPNQTRVG